MALIETAAKNDVDVLITLESALFAEDAGAHDPNADITWPEREGRADFEQLMSSDDCLLLIARDGEQAVGFLAGYHAESSPTRQPVRYAVLRSLYVRADDRRSGAATDLCNHFIEWARENECAEAHVDHYAANASAGRLYETLGFAQRSITRALPL